MSTFAQDRRCVTRKTSFLTQLNAIDSLVVGHCCDFTIIAEWWVQTWIIARRWEQNQAGNSSNSLLQARVCNCCSQNLSHVSSVTGFFIFSTYTNSNFLNREVILKTSSYLVANEGFSATVSKKLIKTARLTT